MTAAEITSMTRQERRAKDNPDRRKAIAAKCRAKYRERNAQRQRERRAKNLDEHRKRTRESVKRWRLKNPEEAHKRAVDYRVRRAAAEGAYTVADVRRIFQQQRGRCAYCRVKLTAENKRIDHIQPIARGGSNWPSNIQLTCQPCNSTKSCRHPIDFAQAKGLLL